MCRTEERGSADADRGYNLANRRDDKFTDQRERGFKGRRRAEWQREELLALPKRRKPHRCLSHCSRKYDKTKMKGGPRRH